MKKENVTKFSLEAAFKALDDLELPAVDCNSGYTPNRVNLHERLRSKAATDILVEDYFDVNDSEDLGAAQEERDAEIAKAKLARIEKIVDLDAESEEDILPSYVGKFIIQCPQCMTLFYKNEEDVETSEENADVVNVNEVCQHCGNDGGYTLVGKVGSVEADEAANFNAEDTDLEEEPAAEEETAEDEAAEDEATGEETANEGEETADDFDLNLDLDLEDEEEEVEESLHNSELLQDIEKKNDLKTDIESEHLTLNEETETDLEALEDFDEDSFNEHFNAYLTSTYANVNNYLTSGCTIGNNRLIIEGIINFNSGRSKTTRFVFEKHNNRLVGRNFDFASDKAFMLKTKVNNNTLITEGLKYRHTIGESLVRGTIRK